MPSIDKPIYYYNFATARSHLHGATAIGANTHFRTNSIQFLSPLYLLLGFSLELYLKAFLLHSGVDENDLIKQSTRHNLKALYSKALAHNFAPPNPLEVARIIEWITPHHADFTFRYMKSNKSITVPLTLDNVALMLRIVTGLDEYLFQVLRPLRFV